MISELKIRDFKSLESVDLKLGHFNLLVGANASGKSNFLDALRFLQGVGNGLSIDGILNGKPASPISLKWDGIRGGSRYIAFRKPDDSQAEKVEFQIGFSGEELQAELGGGLTYRLAFSTANDDPVFDDESMFCGAEMLMNQDNKRFVIDRAIGPLTQEPINSSKLSTLGCLTTIYKRAVLDPITRSMSYENFPGTTGIQAKRFNYASNAMADMQFLDPLPANLRDYSSKVASLGENGEGFAALIHEIESNGSKPALLEWLKELRPDEVSDLLAIPGAVNDYMAAIKEGNTVFPAPAISDGTLRFIALAAAFFQPSMPKILVIEEIEKGLHPSRLRLLLELMRSQSKRTGTQVFATTHSPTLLAWLTEEDRKTTFVCTRDAESGATKMRSLAEVPNLEELIQKNYNLDQLFEEGWLESVLHES
jgi:predicted ATPase